MALSAQVLGSHMTSISEIEDRAIELQGLLNAAELLSQCGEPGATNATAAVLAAAQKEAEILVSELGASAPAASVSKAQNKPKVDA